MQSEYHEMSVQSYLNSRYTKQSKKSQIICGGFIYNFFSNAL